jgi:hypothetical protein
MKFKKAKLFFSIIFIILAGCATFPKVDKQEKEKLLLEHLQSWETIRIDGIIEANYKSFAFRKNITIRKNEEILKIDIYDTGIFGIKPKPFLSVNIDSLIWIKSQAETEPRISKIEKFPEFELLLDPLKLVKYTDEIVSNNELLLSNVLYIKFSDKMQIIQIDRVVYPQSIKFEYQDELLEIIFYMEDKEIANIQIDKITYKKL